MGRAAFSISLRDLVTIGRHASDEGASARFFKGARFVLGDYLSVLERGGLSVGGGRFPTMCGVAPV